VVPTASVDANHERSALVRVAFDGVGILGAVGAIVSRTVTVKLPEDVFPVASVAVHVTVVVPSGKLVPDAGEHDTDGLGSRLSVAVGLTYVVVAPPALVAS
jgi:hypothetical protein